MAENTLALLHYLSSPESPLPELTTGYTKPTTVFFQSFRHFFVYSYATAKVLYAILFGLSTSFAVAIYAPPAPALRQARGFVGDHLRGLFAVGSAVLGAVVGANAVAFVMATVLKKPLSWFSVELSCAALYGPAALMGALASQLIVPTVREKTVFTSILLAQTGLAFGVQAIGVGSSALFFLSGLPLFFAMVLNWLVKPNSEPVSLLSYAIGQLIPLSTGAQLGYEVLNVFVPLVSLILARV